MEGGKCAKHAEKKGRTLGLESQGPSYFKNFQRGIDLRGRTLEKKRIHGKRKDVTKKVLFVISEGNRKRSYLKKRKKGGRGEGSIRTKGK